MPLTQHIDKLEQKSTSSQLNGGMTNHGDLQSSLQDSLQDPLLQKPPTILVDPKARATRRPNYPPPKPINNGPELLQENPQQIDDGPLEIMEDGKPIQVKPEQQDEDPPQDLGKEPEEQELTELEKKYKRAAGSSVTFFKLVQSVGLAPSFGNMKQGVKSLKKIFNLMLNDLDGTPVEGDMKQLLESVSRLENIQSPVKASKELIRAKEKEIKAQTKEDKAWQKASSLGKDVFMYKFRWKSAMKDGFKAQRNTQRITERVGPLMEQHLQDARDAVPSFADLERAWTRVDDMLHPFGGLNASLSSLAEAVVPSLIDPRIKQIEKQCSGQNDDEIGQSNYQFMGTELKQAKFEMGM